MGFASNVGEKLSCHGVPDLSQTKNSRERIVWICALLFAFGVLLYGIAMTLQQYFEYPIVTSVSYKAAGALYFPDVYVCPANTINDTAVDEETAKQLKEYSVDYEAMGSTETGNNEIKTPILDRHITLWQYTKSSIGATGSGSGFKITETKTPNSTCASYKCLYTKVGVRLDSFLEECAFQSGKFSCADRTEEVLDKNGGKCFIIRSQELQSTPNSGLSVVLGNTAGNDDPSEDAPIRAGPWMRIEDKFDPFSTKGIRLLGKGHLVKIAMRKSKVYLKDSPKSKFPQDCATKGDKGDMYNVNYTKSACESDCFQKEVFAECKCLMPIDEIFLRQEYKLEQFCKTDNLTKCVIPLIKKHSKEAQRIRELGAQGDKSLAELARNSSKYSECLQKCVQPCKFVEVKTSVTYGKLEDEFVKDKIIVEIAYETMNVLEIRQDYSVTLPNMISNLGGQLGIWLGASILTVVQLVIFVVEMCAAKREK